MLPAFGLQIVAAPAASATALTPPSISVTDMQGNPVTTVGPNGQVHITVKNNQPNSVSFLYDLATPGSD
jgi:hypothetical protein